MSRHTLAVPKPPIDHQGRIEDAVLRARRRGVYSTSDTAGSFIGTTRSILANGFYLTRFLGHPRPQHQRPCVRPGDNAFSFFARDAASRHIAATP
jgi:hypothetical protein